MRIVIMLILPMMLAISPILLMLAIYYPVRRTDDIIIIGYPIFCKRYHLLNSRLNIQVEYRSGLLRGGAHVVVIYVYQNGSGELIGTHILTGHRFEKNAEKEREKVERIIHS